MTIPRRDEFAFDQDSGFHLQEVEGECLLYHEQSNQTLFLNETATVIWKLCDGTRSIGEIIALLTQEYPENTADVASDVWEGVQMLVQEGAIVKR